MMLRIKIFTITTSIIFLLSLLVSSSCKNKAPSQGNKEDGNYHLELTENSNQLVNLYFKKLPNDYYFDSNEELIVFLFHVVADTINKLKIQTGLKDAYSSTEFLLKGTEPEYDYVVLGIPSEYFITTSLSLDEMSERNKSLKEYNANKYEMIRKGTWEQDENTPPEYDPLLVFSIWYSDLGTVLDSKPSYIKTRLDQNLSE